MSINFDDLNWNDLKTFLAAAETGSFRSAAAALSIQPSTVVRRIDALEQALGTLVFKRLPEGVSLTDDGKTVLEYSQEIEASVHSISRRVSAGAKTQAGFVSVSCTDGLATFWLSHHMARFAENHPDIQLDFKCDMRIADILRRQTDISIQYDAPTNPELITSIIGYLHIWPFASRRWVEKNGLPKTKAEMKKHRLIIQAADQLQLQPLLEYLDAELGDLNYVIVNSGPAHYHLIKEGAGIGIVPTYLAHGDDDLVPIDIPPNYRLPLRMTYHRDSKESLAITTTLEWLRQMFDATQYPFFAEQLLSPEKLREMQIKRTIPVLGIK